MIAKKRVALCPLWAANASPTTGDAFYEGLGAFRFRALLYGVTGLCLVDKQDQNIGRTVEKVTVQSFEDILDVKKGRIQEADIRTVEVEAVAETGATYLCLPPPVIERLGLSVSHTRWVQTANGNVERRIFGGASVTIQGRTEQMSVMENDESTPPLIGYVVLEVLEFVVDPKANRVIPNPAHEGKWIADLY